MAGRLAAADAPCEAVAGQGREREGREPMGHDDEPSGKVLPRGEWSGATEQPDWAEAVNLIRPFSLRHAKLTGVVRTVDRITGVAIARREVQPAKLRLRAVAAHPNLVTRPVAPR